MGNPETSKIELAFFPFASPEGKQVLFEGNQLELTVQKCLSLNPPAHNRKKTEVAYRTYFRELNQLVSAGQHVAIRLQGYTLRWRKLLERLNELFPQFVWTKVVLLRADKATMIYAFEFIPLVILEEEIPFRYHLADSLVQQLAVSREEAVINFERRLESCITEEFLRPIGKKRNKTKVVKKERKKAIPEEASTTIQEKNDHESSDTRNMDECVKKSEELEIPEKQKVIKEKTKKVRVKKEAKSSKEIDKPEILKEEPKPEKTPKQELKKQSSSEELVIQHDEMQEQLKNQLLLAQRELSKERSQNEQLTQSNKKLEVMVERLELSLLRSGITYINNQEQDENGWDKRLKIDLREYTSLIQKAKYLEQVYQVNVSLVKETEKMTLSSESCVYEREQINQIKPHFSSEDVLVTLDECELIEERVKIYSRPWFRKPFVKIMKMDYQSLLNKSAYFDVLRGESYLIEKQQEQLTSPKEVKAS